MKRIFAKNTLKLFWEKHPDSAQYLKTLYYTALLAKWNNPDDIKKSYNTVSILRGSRMVFNIKGNSYRLVVKFNFEKQWAFIRFIGTHSEYENINAETI